MNQKKFDINELINDPEPMIAQAIKEFQVIARLQKARYDALVAEWFTEKQAIELCKLN